MIICGKYEVPDSCPTDCPFCADFRDIGQFSHCTHCPVLCCKQIPYPDGVGTFSLVDPEDYRKDWAREWQVFFKDYSKVPNLKLEMD